LTQLLIEKVELVAQVVEVMVSPTLPQFLGHQLQLHHKLKIVLEQPTQAVAVALVQAVLLELAVRVS
jgi:hypothetical protein